ncbi:MAG: flagellar biosynthetic protein FliR [Paracoccaceae bacterium]
MEQLTALLDFSTPAFTGIVLVLMRIGAVAALLPGFGEQSIPMRVRILVTLSFTAIVWPAVSPLFTEAPNTLAEMPMLMIIEAMIGLMIGISIRLLVMALQLAGSIAAQSTSIAQIAGAGATPDPMPAVGNLLVMAGLALVLVSGLHVKAAMAMIESYSILPQGVLPAGSEVAAWGTAHVASAFSLALGMAAPFVVMSFAYNIGLGAINRAMPSLMVAFIGAPAITAGAIFLLALTAPIILTFWNAHIDEVLQNPLGMP